MLSKLACEDSTAGIPEGPVGWEGDQTQLGKGARSDVGCFRVRVEGEGDGASAS